MFVKREDILTYMPDLKRYANYLCKNPDDAQDLVQNTFEKSWVKFNRFTRSVNLKSWLLKIMYNRDLCITFPIKVENMLKYRTRTNS